MRSPFAQHDHAYDFLPVRVLYLVYIMLALMVVLLCAVAVVGFGIVQARFMEWQEDRLRRGG